MSEPRVPVDPDARESDPAENLRLALEMHDAGVSLMRQNLKRAHPDESPEQIEERLLEWLCEPDLDDASGTFRLRILHPSP